MADPPGGAAPVGCGGVAASPAPAGVHLRDVLGLYSDCEVLEGDAAGFVAGVQHSGPHRAHPVGAFEDPQVRLRGARGGAGAGVEAAVAVVADRPGPVLASAGAGVGDHLGQEPGPLDLPGVGPRGA